MNLYYWDEHEYYNEVKIYKYRAAVAALLTGKLFLTLITLDNDNNNFSYQSDDLCPIHTLIVLRVIRFWKRHACSLAHILRYMNWITQIYTKNREYKI